MIKMVNEFAELDVLVVFWTSGTGIFNTDPRRLAGLHACLPSAIIDPTITFFKPLQDHYGLCRFNTSRVRYIDFLVKGQPLICLTVKDLQGPSGQITPKQTALPGRIGSRSQRGLHSLKSDLDITGNTVDVISYTCDEVSFDIEKCFLCHLKY